jgi:hypothetical protein
VLTAVQLRDDADLRCTLIAGVPSTITFGTRGPIALLTPRTVVAYLVKSAAHVKVAVFRAPPSERFRQSKVDGVRPHVDLLLEVDGCCRTIRVQRVLRALARWGVSLEVLSASFWTRLGSLAAARSPLRQPLVQELLLREGLCTRLGLSRSTRPPKLDDEPPGALPSHGARRPSPPDSVA